MNYEVERFLDKIQRGEDTDSSDVTIPIGYMDTEKYTFASYAKASIPCLICGERIPLVVPYTSGVKVCDKCKKAVLWARACMDL